TGYRGKQVRDAIHADDLLRAFDVIVRDAKPGSVYNIGGGRQNSCSVLEIISEVQRIVGIDMSISFTDSERDGDRRWWITNNQKFIADYPDWEISFSVSQILREIFEANADRWTP